MHYQQKTECGKIKSESVFYDPSKGRWENSLGDSDILMQVTHTYEKIRDIRMEHSFIIIKSSNIYEALPPIFFIKIIKIKKVIAKLRFDI